MEWKHHTHSPNNEYKVTKADLCLDARQHLTRRGGTCAALYSDAEYCFDDGAVQLARARFMLSSSRCYFPIIVFELA